MKIRIFGLIIGALLGVLFGGGTGIVGSFGGVAGVYVFATLGAILGFFASTDVASFLSKFTKK